jgi:hypothetical protein
VGGKTDFMKLGVALLLVLLFGVVADARAQVLGGIFSQGATELKDYGAQIAALQRLITGTERGYQIVGTGLDTIGSINQAEFGLHQAYFSSLAAVNPVVAKMPEVGEYMTLQTVVLQGFAGALQRWRQGGGLTAGEMGAIGQVYANLCTLGAQQTGELEDLLTPGKGTMTDDQRLARVRALDASVKEQFVFVQVYAARVNALVGERGAEGRGSGEMRQYLGLP